MHDLVNSRNLVTIVDNEVAGGIDRKDINPEANAWLDRRRAGKRHLRSRYHPGPAACSEDEQHRKCK
jgi:hypothetical protein